MRHVRSSPTGNRLLHNVVDERGALHRRTVEIGSALIEDLIFEWVEQLRPSGDGWITALEETDDGYEVVFEKREWRKDETDEEEETDE